MVALKLFFLSLGSVDALRSPPGHTRSFARHVRSFGKKSSSENDVESEPSPFWARFSKSKKKTQSMPPPKLSSKTSVTPTNAAFEKKTVNPINAAFEKKKLKGLSSGGVQDLEARMMTKWGSRSSGNGEYYDRDDDGYEINPVDDDPSVRALHLQEKGKAESFQKSPREPLKFASTTSRGFSAGAQQRFFLREPNKVAAVVPRESTQPTVHHETMVDSHRLTTTATTAFREKSVINNEPRTVVSSRSETRSDPKRQLTDRVQNSQALTIDAVTERCRASGLDTLFVRPTDKICSFDTLFETMIGPTFSEIDKQAVFYSLLRSNLHKFLTEKNSGANHRAVDFKSSDGQLMPGRDVLRPTRVQAEVAERAVKGANIHLSAPTGSGKTLAFLLPLLVRLAIENEKNPALVGTPRILIISPSRELAMQTAQVSSRLLEGTVFHALGLIGGVSSFIS